MLFLELTNNEQLAIIDEDTPLSITEKRWRLSPDGYVRTGAMNISLHREIMGLRGFDGAYVDHVNGNRLDNRKSNLRLCNSTENSFNKSITSRNKTGYKGVSPYPSRGAFRVVISANRRYYHIGYFYCPLEAARAYDKAAKELHGEFARLNFPKEA
jgi:hypothetical protein